MSANDKVDATFHDPAGDAQRERLAAALYNHDARIQDWKRSWAGLHWVRRDQYLNRARALLPVVDAMVAEALAARPALDRDMLAWLASPYPITEGGRVGFDYASTADAPHMQRESAGWYAKADALLAAQSGDSREPFEDPEPMIGGRGSIWSGERHERNAGCTLFACEERPRTREQYEAEEADRGN